MVCLFGQLGVFVVVFWGRLIFYFGGCFFVCFLFCFNQERKENSGVRKCSE